MQFFRAKHGIDQIAQGFGKLGDFGTTAPLRFRLVRRLSWGFKRRDGGTGVVDFELGEQADGKRKLSRYGDDQQADRARGAVRAKLPYAFQLLC